MSWSAADVKYYAAPEIPAKCSNRIKSRQKKQGTRQHLPDYVCEGEPKRIKDFSRKK